MIATAKLIKLAYLTNFKGLPPLEKGPHNRQVFNENMH